MVKASIPPLKRTQKHAELAETDSAPSSTHAVKQTKERLEKKKVSTNPKAGSIEARLLQQQKDNREARNMAKEINNLKLEIAKVNHVEGGHLKRLQFNIQKRFKHKLEQVEIDVNRRRKLLGDLFAAEEREYIMETIYFAQEGDAQKMQRMKDTALQLKRQREANEQIYVKNQRLIQYSLRCDELRPITARQNLIKSKNCQLQQMRENEARREHQRELDNMWSKLLSVQVDALYEREKQDLLIKHNSEQTLYADLNKQIAGKALMLEEEKRIKRENYEELMNQHKRLLQEGNDAKILAKRKKDQNAKELREQMESMRNFQLQRKKEEHALEQAFTSLCKLELEREQAKITDFKKQEKKESEQYLQHLKTLKLHQKQHDIELDALLKEANLKALQEQQETSCKEQQRKRKLNEDSIRILNEQIRQQKLEAAENVKKAIQENELCNQMLHTNIQLSINQARVEKEETRKYRQDLTKQIEYNKLLKEREKIELQRQHDVGLEEERKYLTLVHDVVMTETNNQDPLAIKHPFRKQLEQFNCYMK